MSFHVDFKLLESQWPSRFDNHLLISCSNAETGCYMGEICIKENSEAPLAKPRANYPPKSTIEPKGPPKRAKHSMTSVYNENTKSAKISKTEPSKGSTFHISTPTDSSKKNAGSVGSFKELFTAKGEKLFMCDSCSYQCPKKSPMVRHVELKHNPNAKKFPCTMCSLQAKFRWQLHTHYVKVHNLPESAAKAIAAEL